MALNNQQWMICHKTNHNQTNRPKSSIYLIYMNKQYSALNNQQWMICHKTQPNQINFLVDHCLQLKFSLMGDILFL